MSDEIYGFIGLGNMGQPMARNVQEKGHTMIVHDIAGTVERAPEGAEVAGSNSDIAKRAGVIALSLPTVEANRQVVNEIAEVGQTGSVVVDTCTIGSEAAAGNARILEAAGIEYVDSPVSGLKFRAEEGTLASMTAGAREPVERARPLIEGYSRVLYHVGTDAGQGQRMKVVNNALCISAYITTSEALAYGERGGLDIDTMLEVLNASSGQNFATAQIFPKYVPQEITMRRALTPTFWKKTSACLLMVRMRRGLQMRQSQGLMKLSRRSRRPTPGRTRCGFILSCVMG